MRKAGGRIAKQDGGGTRNFSRKQREAAEYLRKDAPLYDQVSRLKQAEGNPHSGIGTDTFQRLQGMPSYIEKNAAKFAPLTSDKDNQNAGAGIKRGGRIGRKDGGSAYPLKDGSGGGKGRLEKIKAYG
jgi:hypothetical protein